MRLLHLATIVALSLLAAACSNGGVGFSLGAGSGPAYARAGVGSVEPGPLGTPGRGDSAAYYYRDD